MENPHAPGICAQADSSDPGTITESTYLLSVSDYAPPPIVPPKGLSGILDGYDHSCILDTSQFQPNEVFLNVYDLGDTDTFTFINRLSTVNNNVLLGGVFHTSVAVYSVEWCYGYTDDGTTGVDHLPPRSLRTHTYRTTVPLGCTPLSNDEVDGLIARLSEKWPGAAYDVLHKNCMTFAEELLQELQVRRMPRWVTRASHTASLIDSVSQTVLNGALEVVEFAKSMMTTEAKERSKEQLKVVLESAHSTSLEALSAATTQANELGEAAQHQATEALAAAQQGGISEIAEAAHAHASEFLTAAQTQAQRLGAVAQAQTQILQEAVESATSRATGQVVSSSLGFSTEVSQLGAQQYIGSIGSGIGQITSYLQSVVTLPQQ